MVKNKLRCAGNRALVNGTVKTDRFQKAFTSGMEEIGRPDHVNGLVLENEAAEMDGCHFVCYAVQKSFGLKVQLKMNVYK